MWFKAIAIIAAVALFFSCSNNGTSNNDVVRKVKVTTVKKDSAFIKKEFPGIIKEARGVNLAFRVAGALRDIHVKPGEYVREGQLLAEIDRRDYQIQVDVAQAQFEQVHAETNRVKELHSRKSVTDAEYEKAVAGEKLVTAQLKHALDQLKDTRLYAPFSGYIQKVNYKNGELLNTGMTVATLIDISHFEIEADIPSSFLIYINDFISYTCEPGIDNSVELPLKLKGYSRKAGNNQLHKFFFSLNPSSGTNLSPGMEVKVNFYYKTGEDSHYYIPLKAIFQRDKKSYVWVYHPEEGVVKSREVITNGLAGNGNIRIETGLQENELIVVAGVNVLQENQQVELLGEPTETNIGGLL